MSLTPATTLSCPRCKSALAEPSRFCPSCGVDMTRATGGTPVLDDHPPADRRLSDSNKAWLGKIVDGRYRVLDVIGRGGMGVVYRVEHMRMGKVAAMKVLHRDLVSDTEVVQRFEREAAAVSKLHHPHTVQVFDFGTAHDALYLIMEYVRGQDLARILERDGALPWARAAPLLAQICGALEEAHELGIVHRDLKPENVLITRTANGRDYAKVLDFGLAKLGERDTNPAATDKQQIVGTPYFMAPEQIRGDDVDARTDIYSFGALMFELLTGQHLYSGSTAVGVLTKHLTAEPDAPSMRVPKMGIPPQVDHLCRKALARDPAKRWQSAGELAAAIEEVYAETVGDVTPGGGTRRPPSKTKSKALGGGTVTRRLDFDPAMIAQSSAHLRRSDLDAYERSLKRGRYVVLAGAVVVLGAVGAAAGWFLTRPAPPLESEREPNDDVNQANRIALDRPVTGYLGKRHSASEGDRDVFVVPGGASEKRVVTIKVTAPPNLDVSLAIADVDGMHGATADEGGIGKDEVLHRRGIDGPVVITVGETVHGNMPVENVSDPYTLTVTTETDPGEIEPNDTAADATALQDGVELHGDLDGARDIDQLKWDGPDGTYTVVVRADGVALEWRTPDGKRRTPGAAKVELKHGDRIELEHSDAKALGTPVAGHEQGWSVIVTKS